MVGLVGGEEQRLGSRCDVVAVEYELTDLCAEGRAARLAGDDDLAAALLEDLGEQAHLGRLARTVAALEADEEPGAVCRAAGTRARRKVLRHAPSLCDPGDGHSPPPPLQQTQTDP